MPVDQHQHNKSRGAPAGGSFLQGVWVLFGSCCPTRLGLRAGMALQDYAKPCLWAVFYSSCCSKQAVVRRADGFNQ